MANLLNFKFGLQPSLASQALQAGTVYVTTDEHALYLDLPKTPDSTELQRIRIGDIIVVESARTAKPPFAEGAFYYFVAENALLRWDGTAWKQLNADTDLTSVETSIQNEVNRSTAKDTEHDNAIKALQEALANYVTIASFTEFKTANTKAIEEAKKAGTDAQATANTAVANAATAQGTADNALAIANKAILKDGSVAMTADLDLGTKKIVNLAGPDNDNDAANKAYVDAAEASAKADASGALSRANEAYNLADTANKAAGTAQSTADGAVTAAAAAQSTADTAVANAATADGKAVTAQNDINAWKEAHANDYTNKQIDDKVSAAEGLANAAQSTADTAVANAATADGKAVAADAKAVAADGKAVAAQNTIDAWKEAHKDDYTNEQIDNKVTGAVNLANTAQDTADTAKANAEAAQGTANKAVADAATADGKAVQAQKDIDAWKTAHKNDYSNDQIDGKITTVTGLVTTAQNTADTAKANAQTAQNKANEAYALANDKATLEDVAKVGYALKTEAQAMADAVKGDSGDGEDEATVYGAIALANKARKEAASAQSTADSKVTMADVEAKGYATVTELNTKAGELLGSDADDAKDFTIHGAHKAAAAALARAEVGVANAATAQGAAEAAQGTAEKGVEDAGKAQAAADKAQETADKAVEDAGKAQDAADAAQADIDAWEAAHKDDYTNKQIDEKVSAVQKTADKAVEDAAKAQKQADKGVEDAAAALAKAQEKLDLKGGTMTGPINMGESAITNVADLTENSDGKHAANKNYVDGKITTVTNSINTLSNTLDGVKTTADGAVQKSGDTMSGELKMGSNKITGLAGPGEDDTAAANKAYVDSAIAAGIKANDAMTFKGTVGGSGATVSDLPATAQKGDTYKVAQAGTYNNVEAKIGDLFINSADDDAEATWVHVSSGYEAEYVQTLIADTTTVYLTDGVNDTVGQAVNGVKFVGNANSNLQFAVSTEGNIHTVTASMVWGTF